jgi:hypothetical protein
MRRRDLNTVLASIAATTTGQTFFGKWLQAAEGAHAHAFNGAAPDESRQWSEYAPQFFTPKEFAAIDAFAATMIPTDQTPGAREAHVPQFLDFVIHAAAEHAPEMQQQWRSFAQHLQSAGFAQQTPSQQIEFVQHLSRGESDPQDVDDLFPLYKQAKRLIVFAYYTSRVGLIDNLEYKGLAYLTTFPGCDHPEHQKV